MPKEYVYKLSLDDGDVTTTLNELDNRLSNLGKRYETAFNKIGTSLGASAKAASGAAKKALDEAATSQVRVTTTAESLEKQQVRLLATELKLAAAGDRAARAFIDQAAAGAKNADALAKAVMSSRKLDANQIALAGSIVQAKTKITEQTRALSGEGEEATQAAIELRNLQARLESLTEERRDAIQASRDHAAAMREENEAAAGGAGPAEKKEKPPSLDPSPGTSGIVDPPRPVKAPKAGDIAVDIDKREKAYVRLLAAELNVAAAGDRVAQTFIKQAAAGAQNSDVLLGLVQSSTSLSEAEIKVANDIARHRESITELTGMMSKQGAETEVLTDAITSHQNAINKLDSERAESKRVTAENRKELARLDKEYKKLLVTELNTAAGTDKSTKEFIKQAAAATENANAIGQSVAASTKLTEQEVRQAHAVANHKQHIIELTAALGKEGADVDKITDKIGRHKQAITELNAAQAGRKKAAEAQAKVTVQAEDQVADAVQETAKKEDQAADQAVQGTQEEIDALDRKIAALEKVMRLTEADQELRRTKAVEIQDKIVDAKTPQDPDHGLRAGLQIQPWYVTDEDVAKGKAEEAKFVDDLREALEEEQSARAALLEQYGLYSDQLDELKTKREQLAQVTTEGAQEEAQASDQAVQSTQEEIAVLDQKIERLQTAKGLIVASISEAQTKVGAAKEDVTTTHRLAKDSLQGLEGAAPEDVADRKEDYEEALSAYEAANKAHFEEAANLKVLEGQYASNIDQLNELTAARVQLTDATTQGAQEEAQVSDQAVQNTQEEIAALDQKWERLQTLKSAAVTDVVEGKGKVEFAEEQVAAADESEVEAATQALEEEKAALAASEAQYASYLEQINETEDARRQLTEATAQGAEQQRAGADATEDLTERIEAEQEATDDLASSKQGAQGASEGAGAAKREEADASEDTRTEAEKEAQAQAEAEASAALLERAYKKLLAQELNLIASGDKLSQEFIKNADAGAKSADALLHTAGLTDQLSEEQIAYADKIAFTKAQIQQLTAEMDNEGADVVALSEKIRALQGSLESMSAEQEAAAAAAQAVTNNMQAEADAADAAAAADAKRAKTTKDAATANRKANRAFTKLAKSFPQIKQGLVELTGQYGTFKTTLGETGQATGKAQRELHQLFQDNPKFAAELRRLTAEYGNFVAEINRSDFGPRLKSHEQSVRQLGFAMQRMGIGGTAAFGEIFAALGPLGIAVGAIIVPIVAVTKALKKMGQVATETFKKLIAESFEAAKAFETTEAAFKAIFDADASAVNFAIRSTRKESERLGVALEELLPKILPRVSDLDQAFKVAELIPGLAASAIDLGPSDALRSIIEALAGDLVSLRKAFEIDVSGIRKAQEEFGNVDGLIRGLTATLEGMGLTFADQVDTINVKIGQMEQKFRSFKLLIGSPIVDALKEQLAEMFGFLNENADTLDNVATMIGMIVANLATDLGETVFDKLNEIDPDDIERIANSLGEIADRFLGQVADLSTGLQTGGLADFFEGLANRVRELDRALNTLKLFKTLIDQVMSFANMLGGSFLGDAFGDLMGQVFDVSGALKSLIMILGITTGAVGGFIANVKALITSIDDVLLGKKTISEAVNDAVKEGQKVFLDSMERTTNLINDYTPATLAAADATNELGEGSEDAANQITALKHALKSLTDAEDDFLDKQKEINDAIKEFAIDAEMKFQGMLTDLSRNLQKAAIDNARKLIDIETKNRQKIDDIREKFDDDVIDAAQDLADKEADILRKDGRKQIEIEEDLNDERLKIEQDYLDALEKLRDKFNFDAFEAMLSNDAKRLAQLRRRQAFEEKQAEKDRDRGLRDAEGGADDERAENAQQLEYALQDARINNARKIRDLSEALKEQFEAQEQARKQEVEAQALAELRKQNDLRTSFAQQLEDYDIWWLERHRKTSEGILEDLEKMRQWMTDRNDILAEIQAVGQVASQIPMEQLQQETQALVLQALNTGQLSADVLPGAQDLIDLQNFLGPGEISYSDELAKEIAELNRSELEDLFNSLANTLNLPSILEQQALDLMLQKIEALGFHRPQGMFEEQFETVQALSNDELLTLIAELTAELAGVELPEIPEGMEAMMSLFPEQLAGVSQPSTLLEQYTELMNQAPVSGVAGATGAFGPTVQVPDDLDPTEAADQPLTLGQYTELMNQPPVSGVAGATGAFGPTIQGTGVPFTIPPEVSAQQQAEQDAGITMSGTPFVQPPTGYGFPPTLPADQAGFENFFLPGNMLPVSPTYGFDQEAYFDGLLDEAQAQAEAELEKRGEIAETVDLAALLAEERSLLHASMLDDQVEMTRIATDAEIAVLEAALAKQKITRDQIMGDEDLEVDIAALDESIRVLEELIADSKAAQAAAAEEMIAADLAATTAAEDEKIEKIDETTAATKEAWSDRLGFAKSDLQEEETAFDAAANALVDATRGQLQERGLANQGYRDSELEAEELSNEEKFDLFSVYGRNRLDEQHQWWSSHLRLQTQGYTNDLNLMQQWLASRQILWSQSLTTVPSEGGLPSDPDEDPADPGEGFTASLADLQSLALSLAEQVGLNMQFVAHDVRDMSIIELQNFIFELQEMLDGATGLAIGGSFLPNQLIKVGEDGEEFLRFNQAGRIDTARNMMAFSPPSVPTNGAAANIDQSIHMGGFNFPDPRGLSPIQKAEMENIAANIVKKSIPTGRVR